MAKEEEEEEKEEEEKEGVSLAVVAATAEAVKAKYHESSEQKVTFSEDESYFQVRL